MLKAFLLAQAVELAHASASRICAAWFRRGMVDCRKGTGYQLRWVGVKAAGRGVPECDDLA